MRDYLRLTQTIDKFISKGRRQEIFDNRVVQKGTRLTFKSHLYLQMSE